MCIRWFYHRLSNTFRFSDKIITLFNIRCHGGLESVKMGIVQGVLIVVCIFTPPINLRIRCYKPVPVLRSFTHRCIINFYGNFCLVHTIGVCFFFWNLSDSQSYSDAVGNIYEASTFSFTVFMWNTLSAYSSMEHDVYSNSFQILLISLDFGNVTFKNE